MTDSVRNVNGPDDESVEGQGGVSREDQVDQRSREADQEVGPDPLFGDGGEASAPGASAGEVAVEEAPTDGEESAGRDAESELAEVRSELDVLNDRHLRLAAEFNNFRRRTEAERLDLWARAQAELVGRLLEVLDDLQRVAALDLTNATVEGIMEGIDLVERKFVRTLGEAGVEVLDPVGEPFDPNTMEAMMRVPTEDPEKDDVVDQVFQKGYTFKGQLVRAARVSVFKHE